MKDYLIYFAQAYPNFRRAELESLAAYHGISIDLSHHDEKNPFLIVKLENDEQARKIMARSILGRGIYELWGQGKNLEELHEDVKQRSSDRFDEYKKMSFKFDFIGYMGKRTTKEKFEMIESFSYLAFEGPIRMKNPDEIFDVLEEYHVHGTEKATTPINMWFGRQIQLSARTENILDKYDLRRRKYIGTTSFDAELSLVSCNIAQVGPGKITYDPFTGTGSFLVAAANFGGLPIGSDIDVRILRGKNDKCNINANFKQYGTTLNFLDILTMDFTNNAFRSDLKIDTIVCDPPYGVREGLKVCGAKDPEKAAGRENVVIDGEKAHLRKDFIQPKKPYELSNLLDDLLHFAANRLPVDGRLAFWMPTANDDFEPNLIPQHENLELIYNLEQEFNKWSRRLLVYVRRDDDFKGETSNGLRANQIKNFRDRYFKGFSQKSK
ncbi:DEHA2F16676p [Debaryomyces hansenii CBS767]|jgi:tRNA (guanine10-N2)-methyltransferase|uniref:tRNA (guanine(10)-N(2))-methyltransferase n=1 Tax=Debaryomyces hansenii (strain ATCC 36239 / CBS 767 / BCRC 21394 / JCM 1990 / NBRC 0083 / IGC 2968) TaxID=284592 RepID=Q6BL36_DEBHA|nr:DEHA2F16676p [Debaryomyces hansenii CBS767]CAG89467.1 DEHA2F16676p [Debaryomyces hansenii CBS767]|eukprot:XP_461085.1 DEHA2F16676p [Debaryomyces hansenii CBS767]